MTESWPLKLRVRPLTTTDADDIAAWRYDGPWTIYNPPASLRAEDGYWAVSGADDVLVGYLCLGFDARVPGLDAADDREDLGVGMRPDLTGSGHGKAFGATVLAFAREHTGVRRLRAVVQSWNTRSRRLFRSLGFTETGVHTCIQNGQEVEYTVLIAGLSVRQ
ncbi:MAG: GNAT family N-acetyltransferase [Stackebrandtia sp.]